MIGQVLLLSLLWLSFYSTPHQYIAPFLNIEDHDDDAVEKSLSLSTWAAASSQAVLAATGDRQFSRGISVEA